MDVLIGIARRAELVFVRDAVRQPVRQPALGQVQRLAHGGAHRVLRKSGGEAVDRNYPPSHPPEVGQPVEHRVRHRDKAALHLRPAVENIALALAELVLQIGLVEKGQLHGARLVHCAEAQEIQTAAYAAQLRLRADDRLDADQVPVRQLGYPDKARPVLVCAREKRNKTGEVVDAQPPKGPRPRLANSLDVSQFRSELWHYVNLA